MSECSIQTSPDDSKKGKIVFYDKQSSRFFVECEGRFEWYPIQQVHIEQDAKKIPGYWSVSDLIP